MISKVKKFRLFIFFLSFYSFVFAPLVKADEILISGNGTDTSNEATVSQTSETNITQTNEAVISNNIQTQTNTGENSTSGNTSEVSVDTGSSTTQVNVDNVVNGSVTTAETCCGTPSQNQTSITNNGSGSQNTLDQTNETQTNINIAQNATIRNNIVGVANTGGNSASDNTNGDVSITTGQVRVTTGILNGPINLSLVDLTSQTAIPNAEISGNGADSVNYLKANFFFSPKVDIQNSANIKNYIMWNLISGGNRADGNTGGSVNITTGDIDLNLFIKNLINMSQAKVTRCCEKISSDGEGVNPPAGGNNTGSVSSNNSSNNSNSENGIGGSAPGSEVGMGGPGILGLSDTSGGETQAFIFWLSLAMIGLGGKIVTDGYKVQGFKKK